MFSKFVVARPLKDKSAASVYEQLFDIFSTFGYPAVISSDRGREFVNSSINHMAASSIERNI